MVSLVGWILREICEESSSKWHVYVLQIRVSEKTTAQRKKSMKIEWYLNKNGVDGPLLNAPNSQALFDKQIHPIQASGEKKFTVWMVVKPWK